MGGPHDIVARVRTRFAAWLVTGPPGHLWAGVADWAELLARWLWARAVKRARPG